MNRLSAMSRLVPFVALVIVAACGPATPASQGPSTQAAAPAQPASPAAQPAAALPAKPAPAAQPAKPAAEPAAPAKPAAAAPPAAPVAAKRLFAASSAIGSTYYAYQVAEAKYLNAKVPEVAITVTESGGGVENLVRLAKGEATMATIATNQVYQAYHGVGSYAGKPQPDLRYLWVYAVGVRPAIVRDDLGVTKLADLSGKDFNPGIRGSSTEKDVKAHFEILGITPRFYTAGLDDSIQAIKDRRIAGMMMLQASIAADAATLDLMTATKLRVIGYRDDDVGKVLEKRPWDPFVTVKEGEYAKGFPQFKTGASIASIITTKQALSDDLAYKLTKAMMEPAAVQEVSAGISWMKGWNYRTRALELVPTPLHAGALRYFREVGDKVPEHLIPPEGK